MHEVLPTDIDRRNQQTLIEFCRLLKFSQNEFELILAVCNSTQQRQILVDQLRQQCAISFEEIALTPTSSTLFTTIRDTLNHHSPSALMIYNLDGVQDFDELLVATNQVREEFRQFPFPLVLWLTNYGLKRLIRIAPDFYTWANSITFETPPKIFLSFLNVLIRDVWQQVLESRENDFLNNQELGLTPGSSRIRELEASLAALAAHEIELTSLQLANLAFVRGRIADQNTTVARDHYKQSLKQWKKLLSQRGQKTKPVWREKLGHVYFHLGLWWQNHAQHHRQDSEASQRLACKYFELSVQTFKRVQKLDLVAKYINHWAESLHHSKQWHKLETVTNQALSLHQQQKYPFRVARARGLLAEIALFKNDWLSAQRHAEIALAIIHSISEITPDKILSEDTSFYNWINSFHRSWYLFSLGKAQFKQGQIDASIETLKRAQKNIQPEYDPELYSCILEYLRQSYFQQSKYLNALEIKRCKDELENRFGYLAFIGVRQFQPKQSISNSVTFTPENSRGLILVSGRKRDLEKLIQRFYQPEHVLTIIYGPSGVGKSSLIEAGLIPALQRTRFETRQIVTVYIRQYRNWLEDLRANISGGSVGKERPQTVEGLPLFSEDLPLEERVLELLRVQTQRNRLIVLIFDQFEEFFFEFKHPEVRRPFCEFFRDCLNMPYIKVVLSLRENYTHALLELERLAFLEIIDNNILDKNWLYYLRNFSPQEAKDVINDLTQPTPYTPDTELVDQVVQDLAAESGEVRPIELQIVGAQLQAEDITTLDEYYATGNQYTSNKDRAIAS
ncbi:MAG: hypothetical protein AAF243_16945 [Cyanobacteria bacterium P01_A01_bin.137]